ncbi:Vacuolar amino acid transporter 7 [Gurleya vavrai]
MKNLSKNINKISCICKLMLGASIVTLPYVFKNMSILWASLSIIFCMIINIFSLKFIFVSADHSECDDLIKLAKYCGNRTAEIIMAFLLFSSSIVTLTFYLSITLDYFIDIFQYFEIYIDTEVLRIFIALLVIISCFVFKKSKNLHYSSHFGLALLLIFLFYISFQFFSSFNLIKFEQFNYTGFTPKTLESFSLVLFVFYSQDCILPLINEFADNKDITKNIWLSNIICAFLYILIGSLGYFIVPNAGINVLSNLETNFFVMTIKFSLSLANILTYPINILPTRLALLFKMKKNTDFDQNSSIIYNMTIGIIFIAYILSIAISKDERFLSGLFYLTGSIVMFVMPVYFFAKVCKEKRTLLNKLVMVGLDCAGASGLI